jgi:hypothetical protein
LADHETITKWLENYHHDANKHRTPLAGIAFAFKKPSSWLFAKLCERYVLQTSLKGRRILWIVAECFFPHHFGNAMRNWLFFIATLGVAVDMADTGLTHLWGFGQLLPALMLLLPFFSLGESYASEFVEVRKGITANYHRSHT